MTCAMPRVTWSSTVLDAHATEDSRYVINSTNSGGSDPIGKTTRAGYRAPLVLYLQTEATSSSLDS